MAVASMNSSSRRRGGEQHLNPDAPEFRPSFSLFSRPPPPHPISHVFLREPWSLTPPPHYNYCYYSLSFPPHTALPLSPRAPALVPCADELATSNLRRSLPLTPIRPTLRRSRRRRNFNIPSNAFNCYKSSSSSSSIRYYNHGHRCPSDPSVVMIKKSNSQAVPVSVRPGGLHTTVMVRNIPNQYTRKMLVLFLDDFCRRENSKIKDDQKVEFDLVYLPIDFSTKVNKGYAFVNFTTSKAVWKLQQANMEDQTWSFYDSIRKRREIAIAKIQGRSALVEHFEKSRIACDSEDYLPVCFTPPRNGDPNKVTLQRNIGELLPRQHQQTNGSHLIQQAINHYYY